MALRANLDPAPNLLTVADAAGKISWTDIFGNNHPVELEIGSGKGTFILAAAEQCPQHNYIGMEWAKAYCDFAADRLRRHGLANARMVHAEALWWIRCHVEENAVAGVHVYFPDPWPKSRHHKRRLIQPEFLNEAHRILAPGGQVRVVTDHADYFEWIKAVFAGQSALAEIPFESPLPQRDGGMVGTNFEKKYALEGRCFYVIAAQKGAVEETSAAGRQKVVKDVPAQKTG
jgi:tRNA (guanine-N7-)-methyltransferase